MKQTVNEHDFTEAFRSIRPDNFSYDGLKALYTWLEDYEDNTGEEMELDVIALCCDFSEMTLDEIYNDYIYSESCGNQHIYNAAAYEDLCNMPDDEQSEYILEWLNDRTIVIPVNDETIIVQAF